MCIKHELDKSKYIHIQIVKYFWFIITLGNGYFQIVKSHKLKKKIFLHFRLDATFVHFLSLFCFVLCCTHSWIIIFIIFYITEGNSNSNIEHAAPWLPDNLSNQCMHCKKTQFTVINRRVSVIHSFIYFFFQISNDIYKKQTMCNMIMLLTIW